jgi:PPOX class probable F420-dependent enzyme
VNVQPAIEALLQQERVARLATVDHEGRPHVIPVVFAYERGTVYTPIDAKPKSVAPARLRRVRNIRSNPHVQVLLDHYEEEWAGLWFAQLRGRAELLSGGDRYDEGVRLLEGKYMQYVDLPLRPRPIIAIALQDVRFWSGEQLSAP